MGRYTYFFLGIWDFLVPLDILINIIYIYIIYIYKYHNNITLCATVLADLNSLRRAAPERINVLVEEKISPTIMIHGFVWILGIPTIPLFYHKSYNIRGKMNWNERVHVGCTMYPIFTKCIQMLFWIFAWLMEHVCKEVEKTSYCLKSGYQIYSNRRTSNGHKAMDQYL
jgi:hypothetical protein